MDKRQVSVLQNRVSDRDRGCVNYTKSIPEAVPVEAVVPPLKRWNQDSSCVCGSATCPHLYPDHDNEPAGRLPNGSVLGILQPDPPPDMSVESVSMNDPESVGVSMCVLGITLVCLLLALGVFALVTAESVCK